MNVNYNSKQHSIDITSITIFLALLGWHTVTLFRIFNMQNRMEIFFALTLSIFCADFISGFVHWAADTWGTSEWPIVGPMLIGPFREHHIDKKAITRHDFAETNGNNCLVSIPILIGLFFIRHLDGGFQSFIFALCFGLVTWIFLTNQLHKWSHEDSVSPLIGFLQRAKIVLPQDHHDEHHKYPFTKNYCITTGWMNPILNEIKFFPRLETLIIRVTGALPRQEDLSLMNQPSDKRDAVGLEPDQLQVTQFEMDTRQIG